MRNVAEKVSTHRRQKQRATNETWQSVRDPTRLVPTIFFPQCMLVAHAHPTISCIHLVSMHVQNNTFSDEMYSLLKIAELGNTVRHSYHFVL